MTIPTSKSKEISDGQHLRLKQCKFKLISAKNSRHLKKYNIYRAHDVNAYLIKKSRFSRLTKNQLLSSLMKLIAL
jgi:hypothetical protein